MPPRLQEHGREDLPGRPDADLHQAGLALPAARSRGRGLPAKPVQALHQLLVAEERVALPLGTFEVERAAAELLGLHQPGVARVVRVLERRRVLHLGLAEVAEAPVGFALRGAALVGGRAALTGRRLAPPALLPPCGRAAAADGALAPRTGGAHGRQRDLRAVLERHMGEAPALQRAVVVGQVPLRPLGQRAADLCLQLAAQRQLGADRHGPWGLAGLAPLASLAEP
mmetsp:Transcript_48123/g.142017  ORF Transcript_48123/g.142017 Transcript_48123/m.142017 type:complete len:227 (+) Transcript_48123:642-1322(+)